MSAYEEPATPARGQSHLRSPWSGRRWWLVARYLVAYAVWLVNLAAAALLLPPVQPLAVQLAVFFDTGPWTVALYYNVALILIALLWLVWVVYMENALRVAAQRGAEALAARSVWISLITVTAIESPPVLMFGIQ